MIVTVGTTTTYPGGCECHTWTGEPMACRISGHRVLVEWAHAITGEPMRLLVAGECARRLAPVRASIATMARMVQGNHASKRPASPNPSFHMVRR